MPPEPLVLFTSRRGLLSALASPAILLLVAAAGFRAGGGPVAWLLALLGAGLGIGVLVDYPRHVIVDATGITRVCWLRRHRIGWDTVVAVERMSNATEALRKQRGGGRGLMRLAGVQEPAAPGGEAARRAPRGNRGLLARGPQRKRWMMTDRVEGHAEYLALQALLRTHAPDTLLRAREPALDSAPTRSGRRREAIARRVAGEDA